MKADRLELDSVETASQPESRVQSGLQVSVSGLIKRFGERQVLHGLDMEIQPGTFVAVVGRSGCGKSTLLRLLAGLETISDGSIRLDNADMAQQRGQVRIMFQDARLLPWRTVIQNVVLGLEGDPAVIRRQACEVLAEVGLADRADEWPAQLSGGQRQRVALARALIHRPRLLLLDEPLSALDALTRIEMHRLIEKVRRQHRFTVVLVTHDVAEAVALADRVVLVEQGRITLDQPVDLPYPREHATTGFVMLEKMILKRLMTVEAVNTRNQLRGRIIRIVPGRVLSEIHVLTPGGEVSATVSTRTLHDMPLEQGADVLVMFKSTEVMLATVQDIP